MKKIILLASLSALSAFSAYSQEKEATQPQKELSNADLFSAKSGTLIEKEILKVGQVKASFRTIDIEVVVLKDLINPSTTSAVRFEATVGNGYGVSSKVATVDLDELDALIKSIKLLQSTVLTAPTNYTEVTFRTRGGFEAGCLFEEGKKKWSSYVKLNKYDSNSFIFMKPEEFALLLPLLEQAKAKLI